MKEIIKNPNFCVIQIEMDLYHLLTTWLFLQLNQDYCVQETYEQNTFNLEQE